MKQTPAHDRHNPDVLRLMPKNLGRVVEVGCSSGALARAYTAENPGCEYTGIEIDADKLGKYHELYRSRGQFVPYEPKTIALPLYR